VREFPTISMERAFLVLILKKFWTETVDQCLLLQVESI
jgi:hypothetical protein